MDLGVVGLEGLVGSETAAFASDPQTKQKWYGSGLLKQERSGQDDDWRISKLPKTDDVPSSAASKPMLFHHRNSMLRSNNATLFSDPQMLTFSSPKSDPFLLDKPTANATLPFSYHQFSTYTRNNTGYSSGSMHGALAGSRGPFTPSQWMELEHQALIYKYITANVPVPSHLLIPIRKALDSAGFCNFSTGLLRPNALGWGGFHLGFSNNTDPEPGRCRRTDGKKWRCSRDAVVDQKYCERHMNRGRHRSRKPVEGQSGHALTTTTTATTPSASSNSIVVPGSNNNTNTFAHQQPNNVSVHHPHPHPHPHSSPANTINRMFMSNKENNNNASERMQDGPGFPMLPPTLELKPKENNPFMIHKQQIYDESSRINNEFGLVTSDSLLNPSQKRSFGSSSQKGSESQQQHPLRHFIDDSPKPQSHHHHHHHHRSGVWPELDMQPDRTQLSISIPISSSDFMSFTTSSPSNEKLTLSPLRLSRELDPIQMGLGVGSAQNESNTRQANWIPITWESSMGGPLGEVLNLSSSSNNISNASDHQCGKNTSALNLMKDGWDNSPPLGSSPTGVLQKTAFGSLSNSSAGSSPRAENNKEGATLCNAL
ncbi:Growth-regulating factor 1, partial [Mucuna pruriens]